MTTDDRFRELYARALADGAATGLDGAHVGPDDMLALVRQEGTEARRLEVLDHVMSCEPCRQSFELLRSIQAAGVAAEARARQKKYGPVRRLLPLAFAASVTLVLGVAIADRFGVGTQPDVSRGSTETVILLTPGPEVSPRERLLFAWRPVPGALRYELEILDPSDAVAFSATTTDTLLAATDVILTPRTEYRWWVRAITPGAAVASPARPLRISQ